MCNHQSSFDMVIMFHVFPRNTRILSKIELYYTPLLGIAAWLGGVIFVDRQDRNKAINVLKKAVDQIHEEKVIIAIKICLFFVAWYPTTTGYYLTGKKII